MKVSSKAEYRTRRHLRLRKRVVGTADRPRMSVYVSGRHIYVQFIDDTASRTVASSSTQGEALKGTRANAETAKRLGGIAAEAAKSKGISQVVFDRGGFAYSGRIKVLADAARAAGLQF